MTLKTPAHPRTPLVLCVTAIALSLGRANEGHLDPPKGRAGRHGGAFGGGGGAAGRAEGWGGRGGSGGGAEGQGVGKGRPGGGGNGRDDGSGHSQNGPFFGGSERGAGDGVRPYAGGGGRGVRGGDKLDSVLSFPKGAGTRGGDGGDAKEQSDFGPRNFTLTSTTRAALPLKGQRRLESDTECYASTSCPMGDGRCGPSGQNGGWGCYCADDGDCCSSSGWCGSTAEHCQANTYIAWSQACPGARPAGSPSFPPLSRPPPYY